MTLFVTPKLQGPDAVGAETLLRKLNRLKIRSSTRRHRSPAHFPTVSGRLSDVNQLFTTPRARPLPNIRNSHDRRRRRISMWAREDRRPESVVVDKLMMNMVARFGSLWSEHIPEPISRNRENEEDVVPVRERQSPSRTIRRPARKGTTNSSAEAADESRAGCVPWQPSSEPQEESRMECIQWQLSLEAVDESRMECFQPQTSVNLNDISLQFQPCQGVAIAEEGGFENFFAKLLGPGFGN